MNMENTAIDKKLSDLTDEEFTNLIDGIVTHRFYEWAEQATKDDDIQRLKEKLSKSYDVPANSILINAICTFYAGFRAGSEFAQDVTEAPGSEQKEAQDDN